MSRFLFGGKYTTTVTVVTTDWATGNAVDAACDSDGQGTEFNVWLYAHSLPLTNAWKSVVLED